MKAAAHHQLRLSVATAPDADRRIFRALAIGGSVVWSLLLHGSVLAAVLLLIEPRPGANTAPTEAISVEIVPTSVLEAALTSPSPDAAASASSVQSDPGVAEDVAAASSKRPDVSEQVEEPTPAPAQAAGIPDEDPRVTEKPVDARDDAQEPAGPAVKQVAAVEPKETPPPVAPPPPQPAEKTERVTPPPQPRKVQKEPMKKGGAPSRASKGSSASSGRVSASEGSTINYTALVRARVASRRPTGSGLRGTVVVTFGVSRSGGLAFASITQSSGDQLLDRTVLSALRNAAPFPAPPSGIAASQLRFSMPFYFQ